MTSADAETVAKLVVDRLATKYEGFPSRDAVAEISSGLRSAYAKGMEDAHSSIHASLRHPGSIASCSAPSCAMLRDVRAARSS